MILLECPYCGVRNVSEFAHLGELTSRPDPRDTTPAQWRAYLYLRDNAAGVVQERWLHRSGCRRFFDATRDTRDNTVHGTRRIETAAVAEGAGGTPA